MIYLERKRKLSESIGIVVLLAILIVVNAIITPNFLKIGTLWNVLLQAFPVLIISMGMTFVIATGGIDISVGATMSMASILFAKLLIVAEMPTIVAVLISLGVVCLFGLFNGMMVGVFRLQPIIATMILSVAGRGIAQQVNNGAVLSFYGNRFTDFGAYRIAGMIPIQVVIAVVVALVLVFVSKRTVFGLRVQAVGDNRSAAHRTGINVVSVQIMVYVLCAALAGIAAMMETLRLCSADPNNIGLNIELDCIAAVALGGTPMSGGKARVMGTLIGALIMQLITTMVNMNNIQYEYALVVKSIIIVFSLYIQLKRKS